MAEIRGKRGAGASRQRTARVVDAAEGARSATKGGERPTAEVRGARTDPFATRAESAPSKVEPKGGSQRRAAPKAGPRGAGRGGPAQPKEPRSRSAAPKPGRTAAGPDRTPFLRRIGLLSALGALWVLGGCGGGVSGEIGRACITSGRDAASQALCSCVQGVANQTLSGSDQRRAARFFSDPDRAEETRFSDRPADDAFWARYRAFADQAEAVCS